MPRHILISFRDHEYVVPRANVTLHKSVHSRTGENIEYKYHIHMVDYNSQALTEEEYQRIKMQLL